MKDLIKRIGLQFFAEDYDDDFADDFDDIPEYYGYDHRDDEGSDADDDVDAQQDTDAEESISNGEAEDNGAVENDDEGQDGLSSEDSEGVSSNVQTNGDIADDSARESKDGGAELLSELHALGYVGEDLSSIAADIRRKREASDSAEASAERKAKNAASKGHISSARPQRSVSGDGTDGFSVKQVRNLQQTLGCSYEKARDLLAKQYRGMEQ